MSIWMCHCGAALEVSCNEQRVPLGAGPKKCIVGAHLPRFIERAESPLLERIAHLEAHWLALQQDVATAIRHRENQGGQQAGTPQFAMAPPSTLRMLERACRDALAPPSGEET